VAPLLTGFGRIATASGDLATPLAAVLATAGCTLAAGILLRAVDFFTALTAVVSSSDESWSAGERDLAAAGLTADDDRFLALVFTAHTRPGPD